MGTINDIRKTLALLRKVVKYRVFKLAINNVFVWYIISTISINRIKR